MDIFKGREEQLAVIKAIKAGDMILLANYNERTRIERVERVTDTMIVTPHCRYYRITGKGKRAGYSVGFHRSFHIVRVATDQEIEADRAERQKEADKRAEYTRKEEARRAKRQQLSDLFADGITVDYAEMSDGDGTLFRIAGLSEEQVRRAAEAMRRAED
ncbi:MAG TPA: hypothetical protein VFW94_23635 [Candidatus Acidoferrales bacterium]|nr:hypothetical protein [Candidatus Acidoferrales bacterium]